MLGQNDSHGYQAQAAEYNLLLKKYDKLCHEQDDLRWQIQMQKRSGTVEGEIDLDYLDRALKNKQRDIDEIALDIRDLHNAMLVNPLAKIVQPNLEKKSKADLSN